MENVMQEFTINTVRVCLMQGVPAISGFICGIGLEQDLPFSNQQSLAKQIHTAFTHIGQPQPQLVPRSFRKDTPRFNAFAGDPKRYHTSREIHNRHGDAATYDLVMLSRKHGEFQGLWKDTDGSTKAEFCSMLECISFFN